MKATTKKGLLV